MPPNGPAPVGRTVTARRDLGPGSALREIALYGGAVPLTGPDAQGAVYRG
jgi:hypothetical protein